MRPFQSRLLGQLALVAALSTAVTLTNQVWVGGATLYTNDRAPRREQMHEAILRNRLPPGAQRWSDIGSNGINIRIGTVWLVEVVHRLTRQSVERTYRIVETGALMVCCFALFWFLRGWFDPLRATLGLLYFGAMLPLSYLFHTFHPWDKPSLAMWLLALIALRRGHTLTFAGVTIAAMAVKYDIILLPVLYFLRNARAGHWRKPAAAAAAMLAGTTAMYLTLRALLPGGFEGGSIVSQVTANLEQVVALGPRYPPLLALGLPLALALYGRRDTDHMGRAMLWFAGLQASVLFIGSNFREYRAEMPLLVLMLPAALAGLSHLAPALAAPTRTDRLAV